MNDISDMTHDEVNSLLSELKLSHAQWMWEWIDYNYEVEWRGI